MAQFNYALRTKWEQTCPDCQESDFVEDHASGDLICRNCGVVVEAHNIDERSEWRTFSDSDKAGGADPNRVGGPVNPLLSDGGMSTIIAAGKGSDRGMVNNLKRMQARTEVGQDRTLINAFKEIGKICTAMKLSDVVKYQANEYYKEAYEKSKSVKGRAQAAVYSAVIFLACRQTGYPRTFKEICASVPQAAKKDIGRMYKAIVADLQLKEKGDFRSEVGSIHPENFLRRYMSMLGFNNQDMKAAIELANAAVPKEGPARDQLRPWDGKSPISIAGAVLWVLSQLPRTSQHPKLDDICAVCGVADATIRAIYKDMHPYLGSLVPPTWASPAEVARLLLPDQQQQQQQQQQRQLGQQGSGAKG
ncbi:hypothetical protein N2152v2_006133 [Parachlorella kessleri]